MAITSNGMALALKTHKIRRKRQCGQWGHRGTISHCGTAAITCAAEAEETLIL